MTNFPFTADLVLLNSGETARKGMYVELGLHHEIDGPIRPDDRNPFMDLDQGREKGQRFRVTFHLLADDETTTEIADDETPKPAKRPKRPWHELSAREQACIRCKEPAFQQWASKLQFELFEIEIPPSEEGAAAFVKDYCEVESRSDLDNSGLAAACWQSLDKQYWAAQQGRTDEDLRVQARLGP